MSGLDGFVGVREIASPADMEAFGRSLGGALKAGDLVVLTGPLGAGKTTLTRGIADALGVRGPIQSPTFVIARTHPSLVGGAPLVHVDAYRLEHLQEVIDLGLPEMLDDGSVTLIEWGNVIAPGLPADYLEIRISLDDEDDDRRNFEIDTVGNRWSARTRALTTALHRWIQGIAPC